LVRWPSAARQLAVLSDAGGAAPARRGNSRPIRGVSRHRPPPRPCRRAQAHASASNRRSTRRRDRPRLRAARRPPAGRAESAAAPPGYRNPEELAALLSPRVKRRVEELRIGLVSYGDLAAPG